jgi:hypothetical protein
MCGSYVRTHSVYVCVCVCVYIYIYVYVCVCVRERERHLSVLSQPYQQLAHTLHWNAPGEYHATARCTAIMCICGVTNLNCTVMNVKSSTSFLVC